MADIVRIDQFKKQVRRKAVAKLTTTRGEIIAYFRRRAKDMRYACYAAAYRKAAAELARGRTESAIVLTNEDIDEAKGEITRKNPGREKAQDEFFKLYLLRYTLFHWDDIPPLG